LEDKNRIVKPYEPNSQNEWGVDQSIYHWRGFSEKDALLFDYSIHGDLNEEPDLDTYQPIECLQVSLFHTPEGKWNSSILSYHNWQYGLLEKYFKDVYSDWAFSQRDRRNSIIRALVIPRKKYSNLTIRGKWSTFM